MFPKFSRKPATRRIAVLEASGQQLTFALLEQGVAQPRLRWKQVPLDLVSTGRQPQMAREPIVALLKEVMSQEKLQGTPLHLVLGGDFCVTRVVAGFRDAVAREMNALRSRSGLYLSLGSGAKTFAESSVSIDAKRAHAALTVANEHTLTILTQAAREAGFQVASLRHSLVALCRAVGRTGRDADSPVLLVQFNRHGIELGVSYRGRLLLDYSPGGTGEPLQLAQVALQHLGRIQRYLARNFSFTSGHISQVVLCGAPGAAEPLRDFFTTTGKLQAELFNPQGVNPEWHLEGIEPHDSWLAPLLGTLVHADDTSEEEIAPDLMAPMRLLQREPLGPALVRYGWPLVAAAVVTLFVQGLAWWEQSRVDSLQADAEKARSASEQITVEQRELGLVEAKIRYWKVIDAARTHPRWHEFLASLGECLPEGMWLENIKVDREGKVLLTGPTYTEDAVYTLVEKLKQVPLLANVALEGTRSARLAGGPVTLFDVKASYAGGNDLQEGS